MAEERKKVWIDPFQTRFTVRIFTYLAVFLIAFANLLFFSKMVIEGPVDPWNQFLETIQANASVFTLLFVLVPVMAWDTIRFTHRLVGPLVRFRATMQAISNGETVRPIKLREGDYLAELRDDFNTMLEELQRRGVPVLKPTQDEDSQKLSA